MESVTALLEELLRLGVAVMVENDELKVRAARGVLTRSMQLRVQESKADLIRFLRNGAPKEEAADVPRIEPDPRSNTEPFLLSDLQLGFYIADDPYMEFNVRPHCYMEADGGELDVGAYENAWNRALARHRRELCIVNRDVQLQLIEGEPRVSCVRYDLTAAPAAAVTVHLAAVREEMSRMELPLDAWPWFDLRVSQWREDGRPRSRIHYNHNNFFIDGFGTSQLLAEVDRYYADPKLDLPPLGLSYRDAVLGIERLAQSPAGIAAREYWRARLPSLPAPPALPSRAGFDRRRRSHLDRRGGELSSAAWAAFKRSASTQGLTPSNALIAAYAYVLATWSNSDHFILSQMVTRRMRRLHPDMMSMLGNFVSLYPLEVRLDGALPFATNARNLQDQVLADMGQLYFGGMRVLQELNRLRGSFGAAPSPFVVGSGLIMKQYRKLDFTVLETSQTVLDHQFFEKPDGSVHFVWDAIEDYFPEGVLEDMWGAFQGLLRYLAEDESAWNRHTFDLVPVVQIELRRARNQTNAPVSDERLHDALPRRAREAGERIVLSTPTSRLTYAELDAWSAELAEQLVAKGVQRGDHVAIVMDRNEALAAAALGVLKAGAAYVPIPPDLPAQRRALLLGDVRPRAALTHEPYFSHNKWPAGEIPLNVSRPSRFTQPQRTGAQSVAPGANTDRAYVIYTSGSTGQPKGVMIDHRGALNTILDINRRFAIGPDDRVFGISAFNFDLSVYDLFGVVQAGARLVYPAPECALDPAHWVALAAREAVTVWNSVPALMSLFAEAALRENVTFPMLRWVLLSGDRIPLDLPARVWRVAPRARIVSLGGATEASIWSIVFPIDEVDPAWSAMPYGYPLDNQSWDVLDRNGRPCPRWVPGELCIYGVGLAQGYWGDEARTRRQFQTSRMDGRRFYRTGDIGRYVSGECLEIHGRLDAQVKINGHRVEPGEIEAAIGAHPGVEAAVVTASATQAGDRKRLIAHIVPSGRAACTDADLEATARARLPAYMIPAAWRRIERIPLTANGKVDREALARESDDAGVAPRREVELTEPVGEAEQRVHAIWREILPAAAFGVTDDFFDLGGQSFDAIRIFARLKESFGVSFSLGDMWTLRTIRGIAGRIGGAENEASRGLLVRINRVDAGTPLFLVHPAGGSVMAYANVARLLDRPVYGIEAPMGIAESAEREDIVRLAARYAEEARTVQRQGPWVLGGWSSGAIIAFAMAAQLEAAGEHVACVYILDGPTPVHHAEPRLLSWFFNDLTQGRRTEELPEDVPVTEESIGAAAAALGVTDHAGLDARELLTRFGVFREILLGCSRYEPVRIAAAISVVRVESEVVQEFAQHPRRDAADWGWGKYTAGRLECRRVLGDHHSFLQPPVLQSWYALLREEVA